jgi:uncharacterized protein
VSTLPPLPPFTHETAVLKVRLAEDGWNSRDPEKVALAYTPNSRWRNRAEFVNGRQEIVAFLTRKWAKELGYRLIKRLWASLGIASLCALPTSGTMIPETGFARTAMKIGNSTRMVFMRLRLASINDLPI